MAHFFSGWDRGRLTTSRRAPSIEGAPGDGGSRPACPPDGQASTSTGGYLPPASATPAIVAVLGDTRPRRGSTAGAVVSALRCDRIGAVLRDPLAPLVFESGEPGSVRAVWPTVGAARVLCKQQLPQLARIVAAAPRRALSLASDMGPP